MPSQRVIPPHPTDQNSQHDDRYPTQSTVEEALANKAAAEDVATLALGNVVRDLTISSLGTKVTRLDSRVFDVTDSAYGAVGDETTNDMPSVLLAYAAAVNAGGGIIYFPGPRTYRLATVESASGLAWIFPIVHDNITVRGDGDTTILNFDFGSETNYGGLFHVQGSGKPTSSAVDWPDNDWTLPTFPRQPIDPAAKGDTSIFTATAAHAANYPAGSWCFIRTGQAIEWTPDTITQPDSEINQVVSSNPATGELKLRWPLAKPYQQEHVLSGMVMKSGVGGSGAAVDLAVSNVTDTIVHNIRFEDFFIRCDKENAAFLMGGQAEGVTVERVNGDIAGAFTSNGNIRGARFFHGNIHQHNTAATYFIAPSTGATDWIVDDYHSQSDHAAMLHAHEGVAQFRVRNSSIRNKEGLVGSMNALSIRGRAYDHDIQFNDFLNAGSIVVLIDEDCPNGGTVANNTIAGGADAINCASTGWTIGPNHNPGNAPVKIYANGVSAPVMSMTGRLKHDQQSITIGSIPDGYGVTAVKVMVLTPFNSDGTDYIDVGANLGGYEQAFAANVDASAWGAHIPVLGRMNTGFLAQTITARYVNGGSEPNAGEAIVFVEYSLMRQTAGST